MLKFLFKLLKFPADVKQAITCSTDDTCRLNENSRKKRVVCHLLMYIYMKYYIMNQFLFPLLECFSLFLTYTTKFCGFLYLYKFMGPENKGFRILLNI